MSKGWFTKEDILRDLTEVTGRRVVRIDDRFAVRGERPPPVNVQDDEEDDDFLQMYGQYGSQTSNTMEPDLPGITHMLRMVNDYYGSATCNDDVNIRELKEAANTVTCISKLNPNVTEFIPKNVRICENEKERIMDNDQSTNSESGDCLEIKETDSKNLDFKDGGEKDKTDSSQINETNNNDIDVTKKLDVASLDPKDIEDIREKLKLKIVGTSKAECLKKKRERNLAMASLLKLYTDIPKSPKKSEPLKLMTPEYFQTIPGDVMKVKDNCAINETEKNVVKAEVVQKTLDEDIQRLPNSTTNTDESSSCARTVLQDSSDLSSNKNTEAKLEKQNGLHPLRDVKESVKKVEKWLDGPEKKKQTSRAIYLGPVTFKRKETLASVTLSDTSSVNADTTPVGTTDRPSSAADSFIPSSYADELTKCYMERDRVKIDQSEDIWSKLERQLKAKDEALKRQLLSVELQ